MFSNFKFNSGLGNLQESFSKLKADLEQNIEQNLRPSQSTDGTGGQQSKASLEWQGGGGLDGWGEFGDFSGAAPTQPKAEAKIPNGQAERPAAESPAAPGSPCRHGTALQSSTWPDQSSQTSLQEPIDAKGEAGPQIGPAGLSTRRGRASGGSVGSRPSLRPKLQARKLSGGLPGPANSSQGASSTAAPATEVLLPHDAEEGHSGGATERSQGSAAVRPEASTEEPASGAVRSSAAAAQPHAEAAASKQQGAQAASRSVEQSATVQAASEGNVGGQLPEVAQQAPLRQGSLPHEDRQAVAGLVRQVFASALAAAEKTGPHAQQAGAMAAHRSAELQADAKVGPARELGSEHAAHDLQLQQQPGPGHIGLSTLSRPGAAQAEVPRLDAVQAGHPDDASSQGSSSSPHAEPLANGHLSPSKQGSTGVAARGAPGSPGTQSVDLAALGPQELRRVAQQLQASLQARELQLERKGQELADMQHVQDQIMARNEELARKAAKVSEDDLAAAQAEFEARCATAERKVYALTKERDALRRGSEKLNSVNELLKEKDNIIAQVMAEGEQLSRKQGNLEATIKKLRQQIKEMETAATKIESKRAIEEARIESAAKAKARLESDMAAAANKHKIELEAQKQHYEGLLQQSRSSQLAAEERAAAAAKGGLGKKLKEAEGRADALSETVAELRAGLERQRAAADLREDMLQRELREVERRCQGAEARHEELASNIPEATRPLLRQLEAMQAAAAANSEAWSAAERSLLERLSQAEGRAASAGERERIAGERLQAANSRANGMAAALEAARGEIANLRAELTDVQQQQLQWADRIQRAEAGQATAQQVLAAAQQEHAQAEAMMAEQVKLEQRSGAEALAEAHARLQVMEQRVAASRLASTSSGGFVAAGEPPAMAAPGYSWKLVRVGEEPQLAPLKQHLAPLKQHLARQASHSSTGSPVAAGDPGRQGWGQGPSLYSSSGSGKGLAAELEHLRDAVRHKEDQIVSLQDQLARLEATRDSLAEELVASAGAEDAAASAKAELEQAQWERQHVEQQLAAATEMLGEKDERLEELRNDLMDVKHLYKDQIEFMIEQLAFKGREQEQPGQQPDSSVAADHSAPAS